jgi:hypothetical protein
VEFVFVLRKQLSRQMNGSFCRDKSFVSGEIFGSAGTTCFRPQKLVYVCGEQLCGESKACSATKLLFFARRSFFES